MILTVIESTIAIVPHIYFFSFLLDKALFGREDRKVRKEKCKKEWGWGGKKRLCFFSTSVR
jgi:hypothetical protein